MQRLNEQHLNALLSLALAEDVGSGDITSEAIFSAASRAAFTLRTRQDAVVCGLPVVNHLVDHFTRGITLTPCAEEGERLQAGGAMARLEGGVAEILKMERLALNLLQRLSGIATETRRFVEMTKEYGVGVLDTRKTTPGWRGLEKYAVTVGGGINHRMGLYDAILIKDNHIAAAGGIGPALERVRALRGLPQRSGWRDPKAQVGTGPSMTVECDTMAQALECVALGVERVLLDNMTPQEINRIVQHIESERLFRPILEASGGITRRNVRDYAATGVDYISTSAITQGAPLVDIGLDEA